jgi:hypothetical protein
VPIPDEAAALASKGAQWNEWVDTSFTWHARMSAALRTLARHRPAQLPPGEDHPCGATRTVGYTDEELDYLYDLQTEYAALLRQVYTMSPQYVDEQSRSVGWVDSVINPPLLDSAVAGQFRVLNKGLAASMAGNPSVSLEIGNVIFDPSLRAVRLAQMTSIGYRMLRLLREADRWGCLEQGTTPCDWSPKLFAEVMQNRFKAQQEAAFKQCLQYVENPSNFRTVAPNATGFYPAEFQYATRSPAQARFHLNVLVCAPGVQNCPTSSLRPYTGVGDLPGNGSWLLGDLATSSSKMWAPGPETGQVAIDSFIGRSINHDRNFNEGMAQRSMSIVDSIAPDLVDGAGRYRLPRYEASGGDSAGNEFFGLDHDYRLIFSISGFDSSKTAGESLCEDSTELGAAVGVEASATAHVLGGTIPLVSTGIDGAFAGISAPTAGSHATVLGEELDVSNVNIVPQRDVGSVTPRYEAWFSILGIPVRVTAGVAGSVSVSVKMTARGGECLQIADTDNVPNGVALEGAITPSVAVDGFATAAVDVGLARAGVKGSINIITLSLPVSLDTTIGRERVVESEPPSDNAVLILKNKADLVVSTLSGRVAVFAEAGTGPFEVSAERELISWSGPSASENVFTNDYSLPLKYLRYVPWTK